MSDDEGRRQAVQGGGTTTQQEYWLQLYAKYYGPVRGYLAKRLACPQDVDDLVQDIFVDLFLHNYHTHDPRAYLLTMARHRLCTYWERRSRTIRTERGVACGDGHAVGGTTHDRDSDPLAELLRRERLATARTILACLAPVLAEALRLRFCDELPFHEAARQACCTRDGLHRRLRRATRRFTYLWEQTHSRE